MKGIDILRGHGRFQYLVGLVGVDFRADEPQSPADAVDVGVDGHSRHSQGKAEDDARRFGADAGQLPQPVPRFAHRHLPQKGQVQRAAVQFPDAVQRRFDARGFYFGQAAPGDGRLDVVDSGVGHRFQRAEPLHQVAEGALRVAVGGVLRQDGEYQLVGRLQARLVGKGAVFVGKQPDGVGDGDAIRPAAATAGRAAGLGGGSGVSGFGWHCSQNPVEDPAEYAGRILAQVNGGAGAHDGAGDLRGRGYAQLGL